MSTRTESERKELALLESTVERVAGCKAEEIRNSTLDDQRKAVERSKGRTLEIRRHFPVIGRGNVMGDRTKSRSEIDQLLDRALR
jgi:hypothetical protein